MHLWCVWCGTGTIIVVYFLVGFSEMKETLRQKIIYVFCDKIEIEGVGPVKKIKVRALVLFLLIPMIVASALILKCNGVF
jgi:hypothetical protein